MLAEWQRGVNENAGVTATVRGGAEGGVVRASAALPPAAVKSFSLSEAQLCFRTTTCAPRRRPELGGGLGLRAEAAG